MAVGMFSISPMSFNHYPSENINPELEYEQCESEAIDFAVVLINLGASDEVFDQLVNMTYDVCMEEYENVRLIDWP